MSTKACVRAKPNVELPVTQPQHQPRALVLIDYADHARGGHYGPYLLWFAREFAQRFNRVLVFTPKPESTATLLGISTGGVPSNVSCHLLPLGPRKFIFSSKRKPAALSTIFKQAADLAPEASLQGFVMWGFDLLRNRAIAKERSGAPWAALGNLSHFKRDCTHAWVKKEHLLEKLCEEHPDCASLLIWDQFIIPPESKKIEWLPGYEGVEVSPISPLASAIRAHAGDRFCLSAFGTLSGPRCLNELLPLAKRHPEIRFALAGVIDQKRLRKELRPLLGANKPENVLIMPGYQEEKDLNAAVEATNAVFIDGVAYPLPSGIVTKALLFGKCIITPESNSWTADMIRAHDVGFTYSDTGMDFRQAWENWRQSGGPERSRQTVQRMTSPDYLSGCFDRVTRRLTAVTEKGSSRASA